MHLTACGAWHCAILLLPFTLLSSFHRCPPFPLSLFLLSTARLSLFIFSFVSAEHRHRPPLRRSHCPLLRRIGAPPLLSFSSLFPSPPPSSRTTRHSSPSAISLSVIVTLTTAAPFPMPLSMHSSFWSPSTTDPTPFSLDPPATTSSSLCPSIFNHCPDHHRRLPSLFLSPAPLQSASRHGLPLLHGCCHCSRSPSPPTTPPSATAAFFLLPAGHGKLSLVP